MTTNPFETPNADPVGFAPERGFDDPPPLAARGDRLVAQLYDGLLMAPGVGIGLVLVATGDGRYESPSVFIGIGIALLWVVGLTAYQWYLISTSGQSLGKRWKNIKIIKQDGGEVDFVSGVLLRIWVISVLGGLPGIGSFVTLADYLWIFQAPQRCLHDLIAKTDVIDVGY